MLLIPEPANPYDPNAIAIFAAGKNQDDFWVNTHVGYVEKDIAAEWMTGWYHNEEGKLLIAQGLFKTRGNANHPKVQLTTTVWNRS